MGLKPFAEQGHYTEIHDAVFDVVMPMCPPNAWKILCFVIRKTKGWRKDQDALSYSQIREGCGISSDATVRKALAWLTNEEGGGEQLLNATTEKDLAGRQKTAAYSLNRDYVIKNPSTENEEPSTESKDGPTTETVETITTLQYPHLKKEQEEKKETETTPRVEQYPAEVLRVNALFRELGNSDDRLPEKIIRMTEDYPNVDVYEVALKLADVMEENPRKYSDVGRTLRNWVKKPFADQRQESSQKRTSSQSHEEEEEERELMERIKAEAPSGLYWSPNG